jgi:hypothetical protein
MAAVGDGLAFVATEAGASIGKALTQLPKSAVISP